MARPKHDDPAKFVGSELEAATGFSKRNIQFLRDCNAGPFEGASDEVGKYSEDQVSFLAIIAGISSAGVPILQSAAIAYAFLQDKPNHPVGRFGHTDQFTFRHPHRPMSGMPKSWFEAHSIMRSGNSDYQVGQVCDTDLTILVADQTHVAEGVLVKARLKKLVPDGVNPDSPTPLGRLERGQKAAETRFIPIYDQIEFDGGAQEASAYLEYEHAVKTAIGLLRVNVSLAIRRAFDAIHELRAQKGGPFHPTELPAVKRQSPVPDTPA
jgi:hypothetical protein